MIPKLFDTHTHFNFNAFKDDWKETVKRTLSQGVWFVNVGAEAKTSKRASDIASLYSRGVYASCGLHPIHTYNDEFEEEIKGEKVKFSTRAEEFSEKYYTILMKGNEKIVAIGEIGLDYFHLKKFPQSLNKKLKEKQIEVFVKQIGLAIEYKKPIIVHCRADKDFDAYYEILNLLENHNNQKGGIIHCYQGNINLLKNFLKLGYFIGYNGVITFTRDYDNLVRKTPIEKIVLETDAPWLAPVPFRGKRNESIYVSEVAKRIAEIKNIPYEEVAKVTTENAIRVLDIKSQISSSNIE